MQNERESRRKKRPRASACTEASASPLSDQAAAAVVPAPTAASIDFAQLTDSQGILLLIPAAVLAHYKALGLTHLHFDVSIGESPSRPGWLTVTEAAKLHLEDIDGLTLAQATAKISRACDTQKILASGHGRDRRIDPTSFDAWRLAQRERALDRADEELA